MQKVFIAIGTIFVLIIFASVHIQAQEIYGCVSIRDGKLRIVNDISECNLKKEYSISWNIAQPPGPITTNDNTLYIGSDDDQDEDNSALHFGTDGLTKISLYENGDLGVSGDIIFSSSMLSSVGGEEQLRIIITRNRKVAMTE